MLQFTKLTEIQGYSTPPEHKGRLKIEVIGKCRTCMTNKKLHKGNDFDDLVPRGAVIRNT